MNQKRAALRGLIACAAVSGVFGPFLENSSTTLQVTAQIAAVLVITILVFVWVHYDSAERSYERSQLLNAGLLVLPLIFVPAYLVLSRNRKDRVTALLRCVGFGAVLFMTTAACQIAIDIVWHGLLS